MNDEPVVTFEQVCDWIINILAIIGMAATCAGIGIYLGYFHQ